MKKVLLVNSSPRIQGNCSDAIKILQENIKDAEIEVLNLRDYKINECNACYGCKGRDGLWCSQQDDMTGWLKKIDECDALVVAAPIYYAMINGRAKIFLDRTFSFFDLDKPNSSNASKFNKKIGVIATANSMPCSVFQGSIELYAKMFETAGFTNNKVISFNCEKVGLGNQIFSNAEDAAAVKELAAWIAE